VGHPADRPRQHGGGREPEQGAKSRKGKTRKGRSPDHKGEKHRKAKETKRGREAATAKAGSTARDGRAEQTPKHGPGREEGKGPAEERPTTHTRKQSGDDRPQATKEGKQLESPHSFFLGKAQSTNKTVNRQLLTNPL